MRGPLPSKQIIVHSSGGAVWRSTCDAGAPSVRPDFELRKKGQARWSEGLTRSSRRLCLRKWLCHHWTARTARSRHGSPFVFPSLGPTAYLFFFSPLAEVSSPRNCNPGPRYWTHCGYAAFALTTASSPPFALHAGVHGPRILAAALSLGYGSAHGPVAGKPSTCRSDHTHRFARHHFAAQRTRHYRIGSFAAHGTGFCYQSARWVALSALELSQTC